MTSPYANSGRILVVDDEPANRAVVSRMMKDLGYEVTMATNGEAALEAVRRGRPDVILLDVTCRSSMASRCAVG